ncbi:MAG TPA: 16S rRNA (uracil(1498)-N(3))-methyltransferase [Nitrosospira sp.]|nr:16S rRNA (uracil(1498)-N(3))-methyltransferase [Nitrosospira sp.]
MAFPRIYYSDEISAESVIQLSGSATRHVVRVLRLQPGDQLILFNGKGGEFRARIQRTQRDGATVAVEQYLGIERESPLVISLAQAVCAAEKMDWIVQKAVELGVSDIQVLATKLCTTKLSDERVDKRMAHWRQVAISACEQCGRNRIPQISPLATLPSWLGSKMDEKSRLGSDHRNLRFMLSPYAEESLNCFTEGPSVSSVTFLVGPEGGLTREEEAAAAVAEFAPLNLGPRTLRTETAGLTAIAVAQAVWGDF